MIQINQQLFEDNCENVSEIISDCGFVITSFEDQLNRKDKKIEDKREYWVNELGSPFLSSLCYNPILCYLSDTVDKSDRKTIGRAISQFKFKKDDKCKRKVVYDEDALNQRVDNGNYNQIAIVSEKHMAGINFQDYSAFIFAHLDLDGKRLLEPVDIEQWIGRIHRTGQVKECRIITVLTTKMKDKEKDPSADFLKWYYEILADPKGLDLFGNNTPDIALLQPIIVDKARKMLSEAKKDNVAKLKNMHLRNDSKFDEYSFSELMEAFYYLGGKENVKTMIRKLCEIEGFGKGNVDFE